MKWIIQSVKKSILLSLQLFMLSSTIAVSAEQVAVEYKIAFDNLLNIESAESSLENSLQVERNELGQLLAKLDAAIKLEQQEALFKFKKLEATNIGLLPIPEKPNELIALNKDLKNLENELSEVREDKATAEIDAEAKIAQLNELKLEQADVRSNLADNQILIQRRNELLEAARTLNGLREVTVRKYWGELLGEFHINSFDVLLDLLSNEIGEVITENNSIRSRNGDFLQVPQGISYVLWDEGKAEAFNLKRFFEGRFFRLPKLKVIEVGSEFENFIREGELLALSQIKNDSWDLSSLNEYTECLRKSRLSNTIDEDRLYEICTQLNTKTAYLDIRNARKIIQINPQTLLLSGEAASSIAKLFIQFEADMRSLTEDVLPQAFQPVISNYLNKQIEVLSELNTSLLAKEAEVSASVVTVNKEVLELTQLIRAQDAFILNTEETSNQLRDRIVDEERLYDQSVAQVNSKNDKLTSAHKTELQALQAILGRIEKEVSESFAKQIDQQKLTIQSLEEQLRETNGKRAAAAKASDEKQRLLLAFLEAEYIKSNLNNEINFVSWNAGGAFLCLDQFGGSDAYFYVGKPTKIFFKGLEIPENIQRRLFYQSLDDLRPRYTNKMGELIYGFSGENRVKASDNYKSDCVYITTNFAGDAARWFGNLGNITNKPTDWEIEFEIKISDYRSIKEEEVETTGYSRRKEQTPVKLKEFFRNELIAIENGRSPLLLIVENPQQSDLDVVENEVFPEQKKQFILLDLQNKDDAKKVQSMLQVIGIYNSVVDGVWGEGSQRALDIFKISQGLPAGPKLDRLTQEKLVLLTE